MNRMMSCVPRTSRWPEKCLTSEESSRRRDLRSLQARHRRDSTDGKSVRDAPRPTLAPQVACMPPSRGLDERILIVVMGEFGRTPRLSRNAQGVGRDHWPDAQTVLLAGGGLKMGQVVGATNSKAEYPTERPCTPKDILATIYRHLGIDCQATFPDFSGRPFHILGEGSPIKELI